MATLQQIKLQAYELLDQHAAARQVLESQQAADLNALFVTQKQELLVLVQQGIALGLTYEQVPLAFRILLGQDLADVF